MAQLPEALDALQAPSGDERAAPGLQESHGPNSRDLILKSALADQRTAHPKGPLPRWGGIPTPAARLDELVYKSPPETVGPLEKLARHAKVAHLDRVEGGRELPLIKQVARSLGASKGVQLLAYLRHGILIVALQGRSMQGRHGVGQLRLHSIRGLCCSRYPRTLR